MSRRVGVEHVEDIEDAVQSALMDAIEHWTTVGLPENPSAWLFRVANNNLLGELRKRSRRLRILKGNAKEEFADPIGSEVFFDREIQDDLLRMLFICCDEAIPSDSQLVFALKTLCGFDVREISIRLFTTEANIYKRLERARNRLRELKPRVDSLSQEQYSMRLASVHKVLYLLFTEGYLSSNVKIAVRRELCDEAIRLTIILADHPVGKSPETFALLALFHLHVARMTSRQDATGGLLLLEEQDRSLWDHDRIGEGLNWLAKSAEGDRFTRYHAEAGIAAEHCLAASFQETRWDKVAESYALLEQTSRSPIHRLNQAVAIAEWKGPVDALAFIEGFAPPTWLAGSHMWAAVLADLHRRCGNTVLSMQYRDVAYDSAPTPQVRQLLQRRLQPDSV